MSDLSDASAHIQAHPELADALLYNAKFVTQPSLDYLAKHPHLLQMPARPATPINQTDEE